MNKNFVNKLAFPTYGVTPPIVRNENSAQRGSCWPDIPADIRPKTSVRPSKSWKKQAFWNGHRARTSMKKLRSEKLRADFPFPTLVLGFTQTHPCDTPFCNVSRDNCAIPHGPLNGGGGSNGGASRSGLVLPFLSFLGFSRFFRDFPDLSGQSPGIFPIGPFPLSQPMNSACKEQSRKGPRHTLDLPEKSWQPPSLEIPRFGNPPV